MRNPYCVMGIILTFLLCLFYTRMKVPSANANPSFSIDVTQLELNDARGNAGVLPPHTDLSEIKEHSKLQSPRRLEDSYPGKWLIGMGTNPNTSNFRDMIHFLEGIGVEEDEDLMALSSSFEDIVSSSDLGTEYKPMVLMKLRNALWRSTGLPDDMKNPVSVADMVKMVHGTRKERAPDTADPPMPNGAPPECGSLRQTSPGFDRTAHFNTDTRTKPRRPRSEFYRPEDLAYNTPRRRDDRDGWESGAGSDRGLERDPRRSTAWGVLPRLTTAKDDNYRAELMSNEHSPVDPYAASLTSEAQISEAKVREGMMKSALKEISPFSDNSEDWLQWKDDTLACFTIAGRRMALEENFRQVAEDLGWSAAQISDANRFVWTTLKSAVGTGTKAKTVFDKAPQFDGARAWWELRRKYEVLGHSTMSNLEKKLDTFQPMASEDPEDMIISIFKRSPLYLEQ